VTLLAAGYVSSKSNGGDVRSIINDTLVGTNLTYYSIAGKPMNYTIGQNDIGSIEPTTYEGKDAWKVRVGESLSWDLKWMQTALKFCTPINYSVPEARTSGAKAQRCAFARLCFLLALSPELGHRTTFSGG
jgi:hypothetical protein